VDGAGGEVAFFSVVMITADKEFIQQLLRGLLCLLEYDSLTTSI
jgi:hypothetical protein